MNVPRPLNAMPQGMPIIPPRLQRQEQQEVLERHRLKHKQSEGSFRRPIEPVQNLPVRSISNGSNAARPLRSEANSNHYNSNNNSNSNINTSVSASNGVSNGSSISSYNRLRSESNPTFSNTSINGVANGRNGNYTTSPIHTSGDSYNNSSYGAEVSNHYRTNSSGSRRSIGGNLATRSNTTGSSFQERMRERDREKQQREREEREVAARAIQEDSQSGAMMNQPTTIASSAAAQSTGASLWNKLRAAKDVINATITGEERWPDSDDSDHEGESHISRVLRELAEKKEADDIVAKIAELDMKPIVPSRSGSISRTNDLREALRMDKHTVNIDTNARSAPGNSSSPPSSSTSPISATTDYYAQSLLARGEVIQQTTQSEERVTKPISIGVSKRISNGLRRASNSGKIRVGNRFRTSSDASLSAALGRLEGKRNQDALVAQVSHLGSTRARSPHSGNRAYKDNIDTAPPPPLPTPKSTFREQLQQQQRQRERINPPVSSPSSRRAMNDAYSQRKQRQEQEREQGQDEGDMFERYL
ncbi:hypothetical protein BGZ98_001966 [Dissophora globulifera]|nr:hypothetical protein BGZ98_001966 [Dissophora globulifera]